MQVKQQNHAFFIQRTPRKIVIPVQAGIYKSLISLDSVLRRSDEIWIIRDTLKDIII